MLGIVSTPARPTKNPTKPTNLNNPDHHSTLLTNPPRAPALKEHSTRDLNEDPATPAVAEATAGRGWSARGRDTPHLEALRVGHLFSSFLGSSTALSPSSAFLWPPHLPPRNPHILVGSAPMDSHTRPPTHTLTLATIPATPTPPSPPDPPSWMAHLDGRPTWMVIKEAQEDGTHHTPWGRGRGRQANLTPGVGVLDHPLHPSVLSPPPGSNDLFRIGLLEPAAASGGPPPALIAPPLPSDPAHNPHLPGNSSLANHQNQPYRSTPLEATGEENTQYFDDDAAAAAFAVGSGSPGHLIRCDCDDSPSSRGRYNY